MTLVHVRLTIPVGQVGGPEAPAAGLMVWTPHARLVAEDRVVLREGFEKELLPGITTVEVHPGPWHVREPGQKPESRWLIVPDVPEVDYEELVSVHPGTLAPLANPEAAWWAAHAALVEQVAAGGATPEQIGAAVADWLDDNPPTAGVTPAELTAHVEAVNPHPAYDDMPSLSLIFENRLT